MPVNLSIKNAPDDVVQRLRERLPGTTARPRTN